MLLLIEFDFDADIIDVPETIIDNREIYRKQFLRWLHNSGTKHRYWVRGKKHAEKEFVGLCYRADAFVEWLNKKVLDKNIEKATIIQSHVAIEDYKNILPSVFF